MNVSFVDTWGVENVLGMFALPKEIRKVAENRCVVQLFSKVEIEKIKNKSSGR